MIATLVYATVAVFQWITIKAQLSQMQKDSLTSSEQFQAQLKHFDDGLGRTGLLAQHAGEQASAAQTQTANTEKFFRQDERAWLEIVPIVPRASGIEIHPNPGVDKPIMKSFEYPISLKNVGKTIAKNISVRAGSVQAANDLYKNPIQIERAQEHILRHREKTTSSNQEQPNVVSKVIGPNSTTPAPFVMSGFAPNEFSNRNLPITFSYLIGRVDYDDGFGIHHWLKFCFVVEYSGELNSCAYGNNQDQNVEDPKR